MKSRFLAQSLFSNVSKSVGFTNPARSFSSASKNVPPFVKSLGEGNYKIEFSEENYADKESVKTELHKQGFLTKDCASRHHLLVFRPKDYQSIASTCKAVHDQHLKSTSTKKPGR